MRILFVASEVILSEPLGLMQLSAVARAGGHQTRLCILRRQALIQAVALFKPQVVAYSCMTADISLYKAADEKLLKWMNTHTEDVVRIMGGAHATYFPEILKEMQLDAICIGDGDSAFAEVLHRIESGERDFSGIPNILCAGQDVHIKQLVSDLDDLPFPDRDLLYHAIPHYRSIGLRSFLTSRGCIYNCSYCYNSTFNKMFKTEGRIIRRRSVDNIIQEIKWVIQKYGPVRFIRFADDTFIYRVDKWITSFAEAYNREIGLPFYCLMRSNTFTAEAARLLSDMGCRSIGMSIESADEDVRERILSRRISDEMVRKSFRLAREFGIKTYGNTMLALPGGRLEKDFESYYFTKSLKLSAPTFSIFCPYPGLPLTRYAINNGELGSNYNYETAYGGESVLKSYTRGEKKIQVRVQHLGLMFCRLPAFMDAAFEKMVRIKTTLFDTLFINIGSAFEVYSLAIHIFPGIYPRNPFKFLKILIQSILYARKIIK